jgi:hypothetical protein
MVPLDGKNNDLFRKKKSEKKAVFLLIIIIKGERERMRDKRLER